MSFSPNWPNSILPCFSCCKQIWFPKTATFGDGCPGLIAYLPFVLSVLIFIGRYALRPFWRRRPDWLRGFATEEDVCGLRTDRGTFSDSEEGNQALLEDDADADVDAEIADSETNAGDSSASSTVVAFGRRSSAVDVRPIGLASSLVSLNIQSWHIRTISLFVLSVSGIATSFTFTLALRLGFLYLTPVAPCVITALLLAIDRPRTVPGTVFVIHSITLTTQTALLFGVPELSLWPGSLTWIAEMSITALSLTVMMFMPMRDPLMGNGAENDKIANLFETPSLNNRSPEDNLNLYQWMTASWMAPMINLGVSRQMHDEDIWHLPFEFQHARLYRLFHDVKGSVTARIVTVNAPDLIITSFLGIADSALSMLPIVLLKQMLSSMEGPDAGRRVAGIYAFIICVINILRAQAGIFSLWYTRRCYERSRGELITMIYEKTLRRKAFTFPGGSTSAEDGKKKGGKRRDSSTPKPRIFASRGAAGAAGGGGVRGGGGGMTEIANGAASGSAPASTGKILNLMRNDVYEVSQRFWEFPTLFTKPLNFFLSIYLLWRMLGASALLGIFVIILAQVINVFVVKYLVRWEMARRAVTDIKLQVTSQFIESIRHLRWYDWQDKWLVNILDARETELWYRVITSVIQRLIFIINQAAAYFFPVTAFYMYTVVEGLPLTIDVAFPALNLFNLLEQSLRELPDMITVLLNANVAMCRIEAFMGEPDKEGADSAEGDVLKQVSEGELVDGIIHPPGPMAISFEEAAFAWPTAENLILSKVNLSAEGPGLTVIFGKVGTGKTALLMAMLGEMDKHSGTRSVPKETIGYCAQTPWLQSMTVRENILFCLPYDEERYNKVVEACCLLPDFAEFEAGDMSNVGENGIGLSGGQKARVALARAVYSRARILLLDDPIAALDHNTAETIMKRLFSTSGLMAQRLVIFVTHRMDLAAGHADQIYEVSDEGGVVTKIDVEQVRQSVASPAAGPSNALTVLRPVTEESSDAEGSSSQSDNENNNDTTAAAPKPAGKVAKNKFIEEEHRSHGGVVLSVYWRYIKSGSLWLWSFAVVNFIMFRIAKIGYYYYLKVWGEAYGDVSTMEIVSRAVAPLVASASQIVIGPAQGDDGLFSAHSNMEIAAGNGTGGGLFDGQFGLPSPDENVYPWLFWFIIVSLFGMFFRSLPEFILIGITYFSGKKVFQEVMIRVSTAPFRFFDVTPVGRLMNRVTSDIGTIDGAVAQQIFRCTWFSFNWLSSILVIATATPTFLVMAVFMTIVFVIIFFKFLPASQSLRRLEMVSLSPLMSNFGTLLEGLTTVRAFRVQPHFQERIIVTTDAFQRMDHFYWSLQAWLQWRFNSLSALSTFALTLTALATGLSSGLIAFVLTAAANFVNATQVLCRRYGELQMQFVSVERVTELLDLDAEPVGTVEPPAAWPTANDDIVFENASFRYAAHLEPSLRNITMQIPAGSTVAVTGRTGSGKSTLALALLGTVLPDTDETGANPHGSIYIGAMDVAKVNKHKLRQRISFVAQDPVLFPGSLRENLDPINEYTDAECELVLRRVLTGTSGEFTLESRVDGGGKNMSQGQRQLIGLGRAVLRRSPIVILDEATASIDKKTAFLIQEVLREELRHSTVITIAHRLEAVRDADFSVVLENGRVIHAAPVEHNDRNV